MSRLFHLLLAGVVAMVLGLQTFGGTASAAARTPLELAAAVERRAASTSFADLDRFAQEATKTLNREGLNRLYHVTWIYLNQGEFEKATSWNQHLAANAMRLGDTRYITIARLNALEIRYDEGDLTAAAEMAALARTETDWFTKVRATRVTAISLMDEDRIGDALELLTDVESVVPMVDPYANTARASLWEVTGLGLMKLNDFDGAARAFGRFEIDFANPAYPRPDFDSLYNMTRLAVQSGDQALAEKLFAAHNRLTERSGLESLRVYDASLCAAVAEAREAPRDVLRCLSRYGQDLGAAAFLATRLLPARAIAFAQTGQVEAARADLETLRRLETQGMVQEHGWSELPHVEAEILFAEGRTAEAFRRLRDWNRDDKVHSARRFSAGIRQVTGDMENKLNERRSQLETAKANTALQQDVIRSQRWIVGFAVVFFLSAIAAIIWQARLSRHLRAARHRAEAANLSKGEFLANMSHEIRTPLNGVIAMADTLARARLGPREQEMIEVIRSSGITLERLLSDILDTARIESGQVTIEPTAFHLGEAVRGVGALWQARAEEKGVEVAVSIDPVVDHVVHGDAVRVRQILTNLVSNALKFTSEGSVTVTVGPSPSGATRFTVSDTGVGFDDADKERIFGRFQQADGSITRRFGGTGLGLAISRDLAELMGGRLDCRSQPGEGATFWFDLPLEAVAEVEPASTIAPEPRGPDALRVLLADDHPANRKVIEIMLGETGIELVTVENGQEALDAFALTGFDLILMDMQMPVMDGLSATTAIRALETERGQGRTPILMLTANALAEHVAAGRAAGADGHLAKPITLNSLFEAMDAALSADQADPVRAAA